MSVPSSIVTCRNERCLRNDVEFRSLFLPYFKERLMKQLLNKPKSEVLCEYYVDEYGLSTHYDDVYHKVEEQTGANFVHFSKKTCPHFIPD